MLEQLRWADLFVIVLNLGVMIAIGVHTSRKSKSPEAYFLANRSMPGWVVGISLMATIISSMTFLAMPGFAYQQDWRYIPGHMTYLIANAAALFLFLPFFRAGRFNSAYEYLERRFGRWARLYAAAGFILFQMFRLGVILYAVSLAIETLSGLPLPWIIIAFGILVAFYTTAGGLEAVIWTDVLQGCALVGGGLLCVPIIAGLLPGGFDQILVEAQAAQKFAVGSTAFSWTEKTLWVNTLLYFFLFLQIMSTDQMTVQRYSAMKTDRDARQGVILGAFSTVGVWLYFTFVGTALYVFYNHFPTPELASLQPEQVFPYFILTRMPAGLAGLIISGLLAAAMSTLDSSINASSATVTTDFYRRLFVPDREERHYVTVGRWLSVFFGAIMIAAALLIYFTRTETLMDLQSLIMSILSGGLLGLFLLGFLTKRVDSRAALVATLTVLGAVCLWVFVGSEAGARWLPALSRFFPDRFWIIVIANLLLLGLGYGLSFVLRRRPDKDLTNLTIWTRRKSAPSGG